MFVCLLVLQLCVTKHIYLNIKLRIIEIVINFSRLKLSKIHWIRNQNSMATAYWNQFGEHEYQSIIQVNTIKK